MSVTTQDNGKPFPAEPLPINVKPINLEKWKI